ncbi:MAG: hypothetical protein KGZ74_13625 [Chitinophagaceae bacterium]|nr:hypothetical protein [Chitinophagaceae bacterium]
MKKILLPLSFNKVNELITLLDETIKANQEPYKDQIDAFNKESHDAKENLVDYFIIGNLNDKYCYPGLIKDLPEWLKEFLMDCYVLVHNHLASKKD